MASMKGETDGVLDPGSTGIPAIHTQASAVEETTSDATKLPYNLPPHITLDSSYSQMWKAMKKLHKDGEIEAWSNMAHHNVHATWVNTLLQHFESSATHLQKKRKMEVEPTSGVETEEDAADNQPKKKKRKRKGRGMGRRHQNKQLPSGHESLEPGELLEDENNQPRPGSINSAGDIQTIDLESGGKPHRGETDDSIGPSVHGINNAQPPDPQSEKDQVEDVHLSEVNIRTHIDDLEEGGIRVSSDDEPPRPHNPKRKRSEKAAELGNISSLLAHADISIWSSLQRELVCDGNHDPTLGFALPEIDIQAIASAVEGGHRSQEAYDQLGYVDVPCEQLQLIPTGELKGFVVYDSKGIPIIAHFPQIIRTYSKNYWNKSLVKLRRRTAPSELPTNDHEGGEGLHMKEEDVKRDDGLAEAEENVRVNKLRTFKRFPTGILDLSFSWKSLYKNDNVNQLSNYMVTGSGSPTYFVAVQEHFKEIGLSMMLQNYALYKISSDSFQAHLKLRASLHRRFVAISAVGTNSPSLFSGRSYVYNEQTKIQFREEDTIKGWALLALAGTCETGRLAFPGLGIKFDYRPGDLTFVRGRLIKHGVVDWEGDGNHICTINFNHYTEWEVGEVQPTW